MAVRILAVVLAIAVSASAFLIPRDIEARNTRLNGPLFTCTFKWQCRKKNLDERTIVVVSDGVDAKTIHELMSARKKSINESCLNNLLLNDIRSRGYPAEQHTATTSDGYILNMHRIPYGRNGSPGKRPVVLLMHGLMSASSHFLLLGPEYGLGYNLADAGFDVWMGNQRGNYYSRAHVSLNPDDDQEKMDFFDYSWDEIGRIDIPTMIDYALANTGQEKIHYIGHSQGGTVFLVHASMNPEYNEKIESAHLLAGVGYMEHFPFEPLKTIAAMTTLIYTLGRSLGIVELSYDAFSLPWQQEINGHGVTDYCAGDDVYRAYCELIGLNYLMADNQAIRDQNLPIPDFGGASLKQIAHYGQNVKDTAFRRWDYGLITNRIVYGSFNPPAYDLSKITIDVTMHYTVSDILLAEEDVLAMAAVMPNTNVRKVADESFGHEDFLFSREAKELVTDYIIERLNVFV